MSIYIPGMKLPKSCISCPFMISRDNDDCILQSEEANESFENWEQMKAGCPLVEVPPHSDLVDRDEIKKDWFLSLGGTVSVAVADIDGAKPIIPADPEEGEAARKEADK